MRCRSVGCGTTHQTAQSVRDQKLEKPSFSALPCLSTGLYNILATKVSVRVMNSSRYELAHISYVVANYLLPRMWFDNAELTIKHFMETKDADPAFWYRLGCQMRKAVPNKDDAQATPIAS
jgi:hypothetical protein